MPVVLSQADDCQFKTIQENYTRLKIEEKSRSNLSKI